MQVLLPIFLLGLKLVAFVFVILMSLFLLVSFAILTFLVAPGMIKTKHFTRNANMFLPVSIR